MTSASPHFIGTYTFGNKGDDGLVLQNGSILSPVTIAYSTYGELSQAGDNAILLFHALSGSHHASGYRELPPEGTRYWSEECYQGWWCDFIGPGLALDTKRFFVVCANYLGGCYGSTGPSSISPETGKPYGSRFPWVTFSDIVNSQLRLLKHLGISKLYAAVGASTGGLAALTLATMFPEWVERLIIIGSGPRVMTLQRILNFEQVIAIENDPNFRGGDYYDDSPPDGGLMLARMIAHKTYVSLETIAERAGHTLIDARGTPNGYTLNSPVESYMLSQGQRFLKRFDANTYLRILWAWQHFDLGRDTGKEGLLPVFEQLVGQRYLVITIDSDVCSYPTEQRELMQLLKRAKVPALHFTVHSEKGHDSFLLEPELYVPQISHFLNQ